MIDAKGPNVLYGNPAQRFGEDDTYAGFTRELRYEILSRFRSKDVKSLSQCKISIFEYSFLL